MTAASGDVVVVAEAPAAPADTVDPAERGRLVIADRVVERIAAHAATEVEHVAPLPARLAERLPGRRAAASRAAVVSGGRVVQLRVTVGIDYPVPVVAVTREIRDRVREVVGRLCAMDVRDVDVEVARLRRPDRSRRVS